MINEQERPQKTLSLLVFSVSAVFVYIILVWLLSKPFMGKLSLGNAEEKGLLSAIRHDSGNAAYHFLLGRYYLTNINSPDNAKAIDHYHESIRMSPLQAGAWIDLSKAYRANGQLAASEESFERAVKLSPNNADLMWEAGTYWLINNRTDKAVAALKRFILLVPERQNDVYDLCWRLQLANSSILQNLLPDSFEYRSRYLSYLIGTHHVTEAQESWKTMDMQNLDKDLFIQYVNFLIANNLYDEAWTIWEEITGKIEGMGKYDETTMAWNPGFELEILNGGFDWSISETEGVNVFIDDSIRMSGNRSIGVSFDGRHNPDIIIARQVVKVKPSSQYSLRGYVKTDSLTTTNGIFLNVLGHNCSSLNKRSEVLTGSNFWKELSVDFDTPADCKAVILAVRREKSNKFDNKIEGTAWIDGMTLKPQGILQTSNSVKR
jgi:tetratricopeptide (TPR) repeat protein